MTTEFTKEWLRDSKNQRTITKANHMAQELIGVGKKLCHPFVFFQEMAWLDLVYSNKDLVRQGWSKHAIKKYLATDSIFSFNGFDVFLAGAVNEAAYGMPDGAVKRRIVIRKLCR